jgi:phytase-like protein
VFRAVPGAAFLVGFVLAGCPAARLEPALAPRTEQVARGAHAGAAPASRAVEPIQLDFVDDFNPPRPPSGAPPAAAGALWDAALGGLSGLYYSEAEQLLYAVTDDPRRYAPRLYTFEVALSERSLVLTPRAVVLLHEAKASSLLEGIDCEGLSSDGAGGLLIATEANDDRPAQLEARILRVRRDGLITGQVPIPEAFAPEAGERSTRGVRSNQGFEGVTVSPSGRWLWAITESALRQDGPEASFDAGTAVRLLRWDQRAPGEPSQFVYHTEPVPRLEGEPGATGGNGVSDLLALDERRLLVLERAYVVPPGRRGLNTIRVFEVVIEPPPELPGVVTAPPRSVTKRLVLDLKDVVQRFDPGLQSLDNFEGITLGPRSPSGPRSLLLVSDDNFSEQQRTVFLAFALRPGG